METSLQSSLEQARLLFEQRNYEASKQIFLNLLQAGQEEFTCHYYLGLINLNLKQFTDAEREFLCCVKDNPTEFNSLYYLGVVAEMQKNNNLALHYYYKTIAVKQDHQNAKNAVKRLTALDQSGGTSLEKPSGKGKQGVDNQNMPVEQSLEPMTLYDELLESNDRDSLIALEMLKATKLIERRPLYSAFAGSFIWRILLIVPLTWWALALLKGKQAFWLGGDGEATLAAVIFLIVMLLISLCYKLVKIKSTVVTIDKGFIEINTGVFSRKSSIYYAHKSDHFETYQSFFNLLTKDCTLTFQVEISNQRPIRRKIKGLGKIAEISKLKQNLSNLRIQLRNTPVIKSGIYG